jgi:hypothetical protein
MTRTALVTTDAKLAADIGDALTAFDAAETASERKAITLSRLLVEAHKRHPSQKAFKEFLATVPNPIGIRRAETLIAIALDRKDFGDHQIENATRQQRFRDARKAEKEEAAALRNAEIKAGFKEDREKQKAKSQQLNRRPNQDEAAQDIASKLRDDPRGELYAKIEQLAAAEVVAELQSHFRRALASGCQIRAREWEALAAKFREQSSAV